MRLAILALSAAAISGCSWLGNTHQPRHAAGCYPAMTTGYGGQAAGYQGGWQTTGYQTGSACAAGAYGSYGAQGYGVQGNGVPQGYGPQNYGAPQGYGAQGYAAQAYGQAGYSMSGATASANGFSASGYPGAMAGTSASVTTLNAAAPYGSAVAGQYSGGQYGSVIGGQGAEVRTVMGAPIYVPQPYPMPLRGSACCGGGGFVGGGGAAAFGGAMPFGVEVFGGTEFENNGDLFTKKSDGPPDGDFTQNIRVGEIDPIGYQDAFGSTKTIGAALTYDLSPNTTILGSLAHGIAEGKTVESYTTVQPGTWTGGAFTPTVGSTARAIDGTFTDLETTTLEAGVRQYIGHPSKLRPYVGATGGFVHNGNVQFFQTYTDDGAYYGERTFIRSAWNPTASATLGAELALGPRSAIGIESGIRWRDDMKTTAPSEDRYTVPLTLRGRLSF